MFLHQCNQFCYQQQQFHKGQQQILHVFFYLALVNVVIGPHDSSPNLQYTIHL